jgi:hypothetical protein
MTHVGSVIHKSDEIGLEIVGRIAGKQNCTVERETVGQSGVFGSDESFV